MSSPHENPTALLATPADTDVVAAALASTLRPGDVVFLCGEMGAGKSAFARAAIQSLLAREGRREEAPSPTYTLIQTYELVGGPLVHADLYRLGGSDEAAELGLFDPTAAAISLIEWPERLGADCPPRRLRVRLSIPEEGVGRRIAVTGEGGDWSAAVAAIAAAFPQDAAMQDD